MNKRSWETLVFSTVGVVAMFVILLGVNLVTARFKQRVDLTAEKAYTLSPGTRTVLSRLDTPVTIRFYWSRLDTATPETVFLRNYARRVEDLLEEFREAAGGKLRIEKLDPQPDSDAEDSARLDGIEPQVLSTGDRFYLGLAVSMLDARAAIPFLAPTRERLLEYDLLRAVTRVIKPEKPVIGIMSALPVFGGPANPFMGSGQRPQEPWAVINELQSDFTVRRVELTAEAIDDDIQVLVVIHPRDISEKTQYAIDQFLMRGGKLVAFLDPVSLADSRQQGNLPFSMPGAPSNLDKLLSAWGLRFDTTKVVADLNFKMQLLGQRNQPVEAPAFLAVDRQGMRPDDPVTSELGTLWLPLVGAFSGTPAEGLKQTVLLKSTPESQLVEGFMAHLSGENILKEFRSSGKEHTLALRLTGRFKTAFPNGVPGSTNGAPPLTESREETAVVLVGDADLLFDRFAIRELNSPFGILRMPANANLTFVQNVVEQLAGDVNLISVRSRAIPSRPFTRIQKMQAAAQERYQAEIKKLEDSLAETQRRLNELQQQKEPGQRFILSPEQQAEIARFRQQEARTREELKRVRREFRREIDALQTRVQWINILAMPLVVSLSGVAIALYRRKRTSAK